MAIWTTLLSARSTPTVSLMLYSIRDVTCMLDDGEKFYSTDKDAKDVLTAIADLKRGFKSVYDPSWLETDFLRYAVVMDPRINWAFPETQCWAEQMRDHAQHRVSGWLVGIEATGQAAAAAAAAKAARAAAKAAGAKGAGAGAAAAAAASDDLTPAWKPQGVAAVLSPWQAEHAAFMSTMATVLLRAGGRRGALKLDVLAWWREESKRLPLHSRAARRILCIQATGVASESVFSDAGRFRGNLRSGLDKLCLRTLTLLNRWGRVRATETTMPAIPLLWSCLSENDKQAIYNGATLAELDASLVEAVALTEREALDDAKRDGRVKKADARQFRKDVLDEEEEEEEEGEEEEEDGGITSALLEEISDADDSDDDD